MKDSEQLAWEGENGPKFAIAAFVAGILNVAAFVVERIALGGVTNERELLGKINDHPGLLYVNVALQSLGVAALMLALFYLVRAVMARRPEGLKFLWPLLLLAPILLVVGGVLTQLHLTDLADEFLGSGARTTARAKELFKDNRAVASTLPGSLGTLCLALSYVLVSVNGMRAGLLSRFMGVLGLIAGALLILPLPFIRGGGTFVQLFWVVALGVLFLDRWPKGRGPAWAAVDDIPWPNAAQARVPEAPTDPPETASSPAVTAGEGNGHSAAVKPARTRNSRKKKRKRR